MSITTTPLTQDEINNLDVTMIDWIITEASIKSTIPDNINLLFMWDSNTNWYWLTNNTDRFSDRFVAKNIPDLITTDNSAIPWYSADLISWEISTQLYPFKDTTKRNIVSLLIWTNDCQSGDTTAIVWTELQTLIWQIQADGWELIIMTYPPRVWGTQSVNDNLIWLNALILANESLGYTAIDLYNEFVDPNNIYWVKVWLYESDWVHFTIAWHQLVADTLEPLFLAPVVPVDMWNVNEQTWTTYTLKDTDNNKIITLNNSLTINLVVPDETVNLPVWAKIALIQKWAWIITVSWTPTINSFWWSMSTKWEFSWIVLLKTNINEWNLFVS